MLGGKWVARSYIKSACTGATVGSPGAGGGGWARKQGHVAQAKVCVAQRG